MSERLDCLIWPAGNRRHPCGECGQREAMAYISIKGASMTEHVSGYFCRDCLANYAYNVLIVQIEALVMLNRELVTTDPALVAFAEAVAERMERAGGRRD